jgi:molybdopterin converting factor small subunit
MNNITQQPYIITVYCNMCNKSFTAAKYAKRKFCTHTCYSNSRKVKDKAERRKQYAKNQYSNNKQYFSNRYQQNKEQLAEQAKERRKDPEHKKRFLESQRKRNSTTEQKLHNKLYQRKQRQKNKERINECIRANYREKIKDPKYKLKFRLRNRLYAALKTKNNKKQASALDLVGCTINELKQHIEAQWLPNMSWTNHTNRGWHIDHIKPCNTFDLTDIEEQKKCFHYTNLRPLWSTDNLSRPKDGSDMLY